MADRNNLTRIRVIVDRERAQTSCSISFKTLKITTKICTRWMKHPRPSPYSTPGVVQGHRKKTTELCDFFFAFYCLNPTQHKSELISSAGKRDSWRNATQKRRTGLALKIPDGSRDAISVDRPIDGAEPMVVCSDELANSAGQQSGRVLVKADSGGPLCCQVRGRLYRPLSWWLFLSFPPAL